MSKSFFQKIFSPEALYAAPVVLIWFPMMIYSIITKSEWQKWLWISLAAWFVLTLIIYPLLMWIVWVMYDMLKKKKATIVDRKATTLIRVSQRK